MSASMMVAEEAEENKKNLKNVNENYFNRHFAHTPQGAGNMEIPEENDDFLQVGKSRPARNSFRSSNKVSHNRAAS